MSRKPLVTVTAKDCRWDYYRGSGKGGQKKNKTDNCARCTHIASGAVSYSEDGRSKDHNRKLAFEKMANTEIFQKWLRLETSKKNGVMAQIDAKLERDMQPHNIRTEVKNEKGLWEVVLDIEPEEVDKILEKIRREDPWEFDE